MTICVSIKVPDGLVLAADSMSSYTVLNPATQGWDVVQSYSFANKLIQVGELPIGTLIWGQGSLQGRSFQNLIEEFSQKYLPASRTVSDTGAALAKFMWTAYEQTFPDANARPGLGFIVGGYDDTSPFAHQWAFEFPQTVVPIQILPDGNGKPVFGAQWYGMPDALGRLINGFDGKIITALKDKGFDPAKVDEFFSAPNLFAIKLPYEIIFDGMPIQDAVDFAAYLVHVVKGRAF